MAGELEELQRWYASQCDGDWEHTYGVRIETLDNPGWHVMIDLADTELDGRPFRDIDAVESERAWLACTVEAGTFHGRGGAPMLGRLLRIFLDWAREA